MDTAMDMDNMRILNILLTSLLMSRAMPLPELMALKLGL